jgi:hypothetical protein
MIVKRGRPLSGERPLTSAERMRLSYQRKKAAGRADVRVTLSEEQRQLIPILATISGYSSLSDFMTDLVTDGFNRVARKHADRIDMARTAQLAGMDKETIVKVLRGEITRLIEDDGNGGWRHVTHD